MTDAAIEKLSTIDLATLVVLVMLGLIVYRFLQPLIDKFTSHIINKHKKEERDITLGDMIEEDHMKIQEFQQNRINDRSQSFRIQKELTDAIKDIKDQLSDLKEATETQFAENRAKENKRARAELKDKISYYYHRCHSTRTIHPIDLETLKDLISEYEEAGGKNSFVHSLVEKEMYEWQEVEHDYLTRAH